MEVAFERENAVEKERNSGAAEESFTAKTCELELEGDRLLSSRFARTEQKL